MRSEALSFKEFEKISYEDWKSEAKKLLNNEDPKIKLRWSGSADLPLNPYYDSSDLKSLQYLENFFSALPKITWRLFEKIEIKDIKAANSKAHDALMGGCDGVIFSGDLNNTNMDPLLSGVLPEHCILSFQHTGKSPFQGNLDFASGFGLNLSSSSDFLSRAIYTEEKDFVKSIVDLLIQLINHLSSNPNIPVYTLCVSTSDDFFHEISRIRALRLLSSKIAFRYDVSIHIHAEPQPGISEGNHLLKQTVSGLAGIIGGVDSICFDPGKPEWAANSSNRISRNISNLIRHEAKLSELNDLSQGSYFIDALTDQLARLIWKDVKDQLND